MAENESGRTENMAVSPEAAGTAPKAEAAEAGKREKPKKSWKREVFEWVMVFVVAGVIAFVVRTFVFVPVMVEGQSMMNTLQDREFLIATKYDYLLGDPERFDVVICHYPGRMRPGLLGIGEVNTAIAIAVSGVAPAIRMIRATVLQIRSQEFVEAAKATGSSQLKIIFHEILPNILSPLIVDSTMRIGGNILQISGLSFIGLGVQSPTAEWGSIMSDGQEFITTFWPMITFPGIAILLTVFAFNVMGDGLRDALDPRLKQ